MHLQRVTSAHRQTPRDLASEAENAPGDRWAALDHQPHRQRRRVPATANETPEERLACSGVIQMKRLWIELSRESENLVFGHGVRRGHEMLAGLQILEIENSGA